MIDAKTVEDISKLARLTLSTEEKKRFTDQLSQILIHFKELDKLNTDSVEPLLTPTPLESPLRIDVVERKTTVSENLENAPDRTGNAFRVPPVV